MHSLLSVYFFGILFRSALIHFLLTVRCCCRCSTPVRCMLASSTVVVICIQFRVRIIAFAFLRLSCVQTKLQLIFSIFNVSNIFRFFCWQHKKRNFFLFQILNTLFVVHMRFLFGSVFFVLLITVFICSSEIVVDRLTTTTAFIASPSRTNCAQSTRGQ